MKQRVNRTTAEQRQSSSGGVSFSSLPQDLQEKRIKFKPGCIPPNKALVLTGFDGVIESERIYLQEREKWGWIINIKYFWMTFFKFAKKRNLSS